MTTDGYFGEHVADAYDESTGTEFEPAVVGETVDLLADLAGPGGRALELAIGTGRVALPLAGRGILVHGIDLSRAMVTRLLAKPGGDAIGATIGDFTSTRVDGQFDLVYLVFNTIMNVTSQDGQVDCFRNAAAHLRPGGRFLIEVMVPDLRRLPPGQTLVPFQDGPDEWAFDRYDVATQAMSSNYPRTSTLLPVASRAVIAQPRPTVWRSGSTRATIRSWSRGYGPPVYLTEISSTIAQPASPSIHSTTLPRRITGRNG
jgi:SAM-dependent methyltransferase